MNVWLFVFYFKILKGCLLLTVIFIFKAIYHAFISVACSLPTFNIGTSEEFFFSHFENFVSDP